MTNIASDFTAKRLDFGYTRTSDWEVYSDGSPLYTLVGHAGHDPFEVRLPIDDVQPTIDYIIFHDRLPDHVGNAKLFDAN